ncbi:MAG: putative hydrolase of the superfamily [Frankiaceae bacterium]|nr:putative hydrolase of the superfamily [Frankiaceae bacterium]
MIEAVLFDWGGTLTTFHSVDLLDAWQVAARVLAPERSDEVAAALLAAEREVWARTATTMRSATTAEVLRAASAAVGLPVEDALHAQAVASYLDHWSPTSHARQDAVAVMKALRERGLRTGLLSNTHWPRAQHEAWLARDGLLDLLDARVYTSDLEWVKPHADAFAALLDAVDVAPQQAVFVGDRPHDDIYGAKAVGMRTVWLRNDAVPGYDVDPDGVIDELGELVGVVDGWLGSG